MAFRMRHPLELDFESLARRRRWQAAPIQGLRDQRRRYWADLMLDVSIALMLGVGLTAGCFILSWAIAHWIAG